MILLTIYACEIYSFSNTFINLIYRGIISIIIPLLYYLFVFFRTNELKYIFIVAINLFNKVLGRYKSKITV